MASTAVGCIGQRSACAVRVTRLDAACAAVTGADNAVVTAALVTATATPDIETGTRFEPKTACGDIAWVAADPDVIKRYNLTAEFITWDFEFIELMSAASLIMGAVSTPWAGKAMGVSMPGPNTAQSDGVALEIWTKTASGTGVCGDVSVLPPYVRHLFPKVVFTIADRTFDNTPASLKVTGIADANPNWGVGPWGDWNGPVGGIDDNSPWLQFYDDALPTTGCGYVAVTP